MNTPWWQMGPVTRFLVVFYSMVLMMQTSPSTSILLIADVHFMAWEVFNAPHLLVMQTVGIIKTVLTPRQASVICSCAQVLIKPQPLTKALSKLTIDDNPKHDVVMRVAEGLDALWISRYITQATAYPSGVEFLQSMMQNTGTSAMC